jgi:hypothetical protein
MRSLLCHLSHHVIWIGARLAWRRHSDRHVLELQGSSWHCLFKCCCWEDLACGDPFPAWMRRQFRQNKRLEPIILHARHTWTEAASFKSTTFILLAIWTGRDIRFGSRFFSRVSLKPRKQVPWSDWSCGTRYRGLIETGKSDSAVTMEADHFQRIRISNISVNSKP